MNQVFCKIYVFRFEIKLKNCFFVFFLLQKRTPVDKEDNSELENGNDEALVGDHDTYNLQNHFEKHAFPKAPFLNSL